MPNMPFSRGILKHGPIISSSADILTLDYLIFDTRISSIRVRSKDDFFLTYHVGERDASLTEIGIEILLNRFQRLRPFLV